MENKEILDLVFYSGDLDNDVTVREWFEAIMAALWREQESFSGKRPLGNSGWDADIVVCLIKNEIIPGKLEEDDQIVEVDWDYAHKFVAENIIPELFKNQ